MPRFHSRVAAIGTCCFLMLGDFRAIASETVERLKNGLNMRIATSADDGHIALRLDTMLGINQESNDGGEAAAMLAALLYLKTASYDIGEWVKVCEESGLRLTPHLNEHSSGFTLTGRDEHLNQALWLLGERLNTPSVKEADVRKIRPAIFWGAESDKYRAITSRGDELASLRALVLGSRLGRTGFESRVRALRMSATSVRKAVDRIGAAMQPRITLVVSEGAFAEAQQRVKQYLGRLPRHDSAGAEPVASTLSAPLLKEKVTGRFDNPRDSSSLVALGWNLSRVGEELGWSKLRTEATADALIAALTHPGGTFTRRLIRVSETIIDFKAEVTGTNHSVLSMVATCLPNTHSTAKRAIVDTLRSLGKNGGWGLEVRNLIRSRLRDVGETLHFSANLANTAGALWASGQVGRGQSVENWLARYSELLRNVDAADVTKLIGGILARDALAEARFHPTRTVRGREVGLTEEILQTYERIVADSRCPREDIPKMKWKDLLAKKYRIDAETYVKISQKLTARSRLMRRISNEASERCAQYERLRKLRSYEDIVSIHRAVSCGPASIGDFDLRQTALARVFKKFGLDRSAYRPLLAMAREDPQTHQQLRQIEHQCRPKYGPGVIRQ